MLYPLLKTSQPAAGDRMTIIPTNRAFQATVEGTGNVSATVRVEASNDLKAWLLLGTITLAGANIASDGLTSIAAWAHVRAVVTAITGTGAEVNVTMSVL